MPLRHECVRFTPSSTSERSDNFAVHVDTKTKLFPRLGVVDVLVHIRRLVPQKSFDICSSVPDSTCCESCNISGQQSASSYARAPPEPARPSHTGINLPEGPFVDPKTGNVPFSLRTQKKNTSTS